MEEKNTYAILIDERAIKNDKYGSFSTFEVCIVKILENGAIRNPSSDEPFNDLVFRCQWDAEKNFSVTYGWEAIYRDCYRVDYQDAKRMLKTLQKLEKISEGFAVRPVTFGQYVALNALALGIKSARRETRDSAHSSSYAENDYVSFDLQSAQFAIDDAIARAREPKASAA